MVSKTGFIDGPFAVGIFADSSLGLFVSFILSLALYLAFGTRKGPAVTISADLLSPQRPIVVIGAAFGDIILHLDALPQSGSDVSARDGGRQIGGCAFNVARALAPRTVSH